MSVTFGNNNYGYLPPRNFALQAQYKTPAQSELDEKIARFKDNYSREYSDKLKNLEKTGHEISLEITINAKYFQRQVKNLDKYLRRYQMTSEKIEALDTLEKSIQVFIRTAEEASIIFQ